MVDDMVDPRRSEPAFILTERAMLESWLEFHRTTLELKTEGLTESLRKSRPVPTSKLSRHGLVRQMAEVERSWFRRALAQEDINRIWADHAGDDSELVPLDDADWERTGGLEDRVPSQPRHRCREEPRGHGTARRSAMFAPVDLRPHDRGVCRHNGHADLIRELLDGSVGW